MKIRQIRVFTHNFRNGFDRTSDASWEQANEFIYKYREQLEDVKIEYKYEHSGGMTYTTVTFTVDEEWKEQ
jgi:hypothetical protein